MLVRLRDKKEKLHNEDTEDAKKDKKGDWIHRLVFLKLSSVIFVSPW
jgi:hypothetical protein